MTGQLTAGWASLVAKLGSLASRAASLPSHSDQTGIRRRGAARLPVSDSGKQL